MILGALTCAGLAAAHEDNPEKLGKVSFASTCSAAAQLQFERGVALLHSFWFPEALKAVRRRPRPPGLRNRALGRPVAWLGHRRRARRPRPPPRRSTTAAGGPGGRGKTQRSGTTSRPSRSFYQDHDKVDHRSRAVALREGDGVAVRPLSAGPRGGHLLRARAQHHARTPRTRPTPTSKAAAPRAGLSRGPSTPAWRTT